MNDKALDKKIRRTLFRLLKEEDVNSMEFGTDPFAGNPFTTAAADAERAWQEAPTSADQAEPSSQDSGGGARSGGTARNQGVISTTGAFGSGGRAKKFISEAGARAESDPKGLLSDLGVTSVASGGDLDAALDILRRAIHGNAVMQEAYTGAKKTVDIVVGDKTESDTNVVAVTMNSLDRKNGIRFLAYTLTAAKNANFLSLSGGLQFGSGHKSELLIYSI